MRKYIYSIRITLTYFLFGILWISTSDYLLDLCTNDKEMLSELQTYKGWFFVLITAVVLYITASKYETLLKRNIRQLKNANNDLKTFLYKASHDLKGPTATILGLTNLLKIENPGLRNSVILDKIESSSYRSNFIIKDLVELAEIIEKDVVMSPINLKILVDGIVSASKSTSVLSQDIVINANLKAVNIYSDRQLLQLIIEKTLENAAFYQNPFASEKKISITSSRNEKNLILEIEDNGLGIEKEHLENVFEMFYRASERSPGTGLGLYITKLAVEKLKGEIKIYSIAQMGTKLTVSLPKISQ